MSIVRLLKALLPVQRPGTAAADVSAMQISTVLACARVISMGISTLPFRVYRQEGNDRRIDIDNDLYRLIARQPNDRQTPVEFIEAMAFNAVLAGDGFAIKNIVDGKIRDLFPITPGQVTIRRAAEHSVFYEVRTTSGILKVPRNHMFHLQGTLRGGWPGELAAIKAARATIGLAMATEEGRSNLSDNSGLLVDADGQTFETQRQSMEEICRAFAVFPQAVMHGGDASAITSAGAVLGSHVLHTLRPWAIRFAQATARDLGTPDGALTGEFDTNEPILFLPNIETNPAMKIASAR